MDDFFSDGTSLQDDSGFLTDGLQDPAPEQIPGNTGALPGEVFPDSTTDSIPSQEAPEGLGALSDNSIDTAPDADGLPQQSDGTEGTDHTDTAQTSPEYAELLEAVKLQNETLTSLSVQMEETNLHLSSIQTAFPVIAVALGIVTGVLLLQVLASYIRH